MSKNFEILQEFLALEPWRSPMEADASVPATVHAILNLLLEPSRPSDDELDVFGRTLAALFTHYRDYSKENWNDLNQILIALGKISLKHFWGPAVQSLYTLGGLGFLASNEWSRELSMGPEDRQQLLTEKMHAIR